MAHFRRQSEASGSGRRDCRPTSAVPEDVAPGCARGRPGRAPAVAEHAERASAAHGMPGRSGASEGRYIAGERNWGGPAPIVHRSGRTDCHDGHGDRARSAAGEPWPKNATPGDSTDHWPRRPNRRRKMEPSAPSPVPGADATTDQDHDGGPSASRTAAEGVIDASRPRGIRGGDQRAWRVNAAFRTANWWPRSAPAAERPSRPVGIRAGCGRDHGPG